MRRTMKRHTITTAALIVTLLTITAVAVGAPSIAAADEADQNLTLASAEDELTGLQNETCEGAPTMSQTSITSPENEIKADQPGVVEANFRVDPTAPEDCDVNVDLEFSFAESGFQFGGGAEWDTSTTDLVATTFEDLNPGELRDIRAEIESNGAEPGDEVTVIADYEIWHDGDRENSVQQSGIRHTLEVVEEDDEPGSDEPNEDDTIISEVLEFLEEHLALVGVVSALLIAVVGLVFRKPLVQVITGK